MDIDDLNGVYDYQRFYSDTESDEEEVKEFAEVRPDILKMKQVFVYEPRVPYRPQIESKSPPLCTEYDKQQCCEACCFLCGITIFFIIALSLPVAGHHHHSDNIPWTNITNSTNSSNLSNLTYSQPVVHSLHPYAKNSSVHNRSVYMNVPFILSSKVERLYRKIKAISTSNR
jgi:hypothetical protein